MKSFNFLLFFGLTLVYLLASAECRATDFEKPSYFFDSESRDPEIDAVWADFQKRHILNPTVAAESDYKNWNKNVWNNFLKGRITNYGSKSVNSFMVGVTSAILSDFKSGYSQEIKHDGSGISGNPQNLYWTTKKFETYVLQLSGSTYNVYNCYTQFILGAIDSRIEPVHFQTQRPTQIRSGALPLSLTGCTLVN